MLHDRTSRFSENPSDSFCQGAVRGFRGDLILWRIDDKTCISALVFGFVFLSFALGSCQWEENLPEQVVAQVYQEQITADEFERELKEVVLEAGRGEKAEGAVELKRAYLDQVIERKLLAQEAKRLGVQVTPEELNRAIAEIKRDYPGGAFDEQLVLKGTTFEEWKGRLREKLMAEKMMQSALQYHGEIGEKEALQYYEEHRPFRTGLRVRARQIVVADGEEAIQILKRLKRGESFEKLAVEKSLGPEKTDGGNLGFFGQGEKPAEFDRLFSMEIGAVSEVIKSPYGYHIFKLEEKTKAREIPFEEAKSGILQELTRRKEQEEYQHWVSELKKKAHIIINKKRFQPGGEG